VYELGHRDAAAANAYERVLEIDSTYDLANYLLAALHFRIGRFDSAATDVARLTRVSGPGAYADLRAYGYAVRGDTGAARRLLADLRQRQSRRYVSPYSIACIYAALGDATNALEWLDKGYGTHASDLTTIAVDPRLDPLRADARFSALIHRMGLDYISPSVAQPR
jgi:tetratricopeptide (TPR) repeat protein